MCGACAATVLSGQVHYPFGDPKGLSADDAQRGKAFLCLAAALSDVEINAPQVGVTPDIAVKTLPVRVETMRKLAGDVMELTLKLPASERLRFLAGQYVDILLKRWEATLMGLTPNHSAASLIDSNLSILRILV